MRYLVAALVCAVGLFGSFGFTKKSANSLRYEVIDIRGGSFEKTEMIGNISKSWVDQVAYISKRYADGRVDFDFYRNPFIYESFKIGNWYIEDSPNIGIFVFLLLLWIVAFCLVCCFL